MTQTQDDISGPWYRHFWPWFIVILLGTTVVSGLATVAIAVHGADPLVVDDYYQDGKSINQTFAADREAALREASAQVTIGASVEIALDILGGGPAALELELSHVTRAGLDRKLRLERGPGGAYATSELPPAGTFYATLRPADAPRTWRLRRRIELPGDRAFTLEPPG